MSINAKILNKMFKKLIKQHIQYKNINYDQVRLTQNMKIELTFTNLKNSIAAEKLFRKNRHPFMIKKTQ